MRKIVILAAACAMLTAMPAAAAETPRTDGATQIAQAFFGRLKGGQTREAFLRLFDGTEMVAQKSAEIDNLINQADTVLKYYGKPEGAEFVGETDLTPSVVKQTYVLHTEKGPLFWKLYFYRRATGWTVNRVDFDDNVIAAFQ